MVTPVSNGPVNVEKEEEKARLERVVSSSQELNVEEQGGSGNNDTTAIELQTSGTGGMVRESDGSTSFKE